MKETVCYFTVSQEMAYTAGEVFKKYGLPIRCYQCSIDPREEAQALYREGIRVFIARGSVISIVEQVTGAVVIPLRYDFIDFLDAIDRAKAISERIALVGWYSNEEWLQRYVKRLPCYVHYYPLIWSGNPDYNELIKAVSQCRADGMEVVVGGASPVCEAKKIGLYGIPIAISDDAYLAAARNALRESRIIAEQELRFSQVKAIVEYADQGLLLVDSEGRILEKNKKADALITRIRLGGNIGDFIDGESQGQTLNFNNAPATFIIDKNGKRLLLDISAIDQSHLNSEYLICIREAEKIVEEEKRLRQSLIKQGLYARYHFSDIIGESDRMKQLFQKASLYAKTDESILIYGETGSGKELFAQSIHNASKRRWEPFIAINCAAIPESILESELFGYVRGAFTGAKNEGKAGVFELANKGTIFLDEIGEISFSLQAKLLRVLQEQQIVRLGDSRVVSIDVRVITATNKNLLKAVENKEFREDLFYRLCVLPLTIPPLRARCDDIIKLIDFHMTKNGLINFELSPDCVRLLTSYAWPGNVRELQSFVKRLSILHPEMPITVEEIKEILHPLKVYVTDDKTTDPLSEQEQIRAVLKECGGNKTLAAAKLGINRSTLWRRLKGMDHRHSSE